MMSFCFGENCGEKAPARFLVLFHRYKRPAACTSAVGHVQSPFWILNTGAGTSKRSKLPGSGRLPLAPCLLPPGSSFLGESGNLCLAVIHLTGGTSARHATVTYSHRCVRGKL